MALAASSDLIHLLLIVAPNRYPLWTSTIGCKSAAAAPLRIKGRQVAIRKPTSFMLPALVFFRSLVSDTLDGSLVLHVESDRDGLSASSQISINRLPCRAYRSPMRLRRMDFHLSGGRIWIPYFGAAANNLSTWSLLAGMAGESNDATGCASSVTKFSNPPGVTNTSTRAGSCVVFLKLCAMPRGP